MMTDCHLKDLTFTELGETSFTLLDGIAHAFVHVPSVLHHAMVTIRKLLTSFFYTLWCSGSSEAMRGMTPNRDSK